MQLKTARLTVLITPAIKKAFEEQCRSDDVTPSQVVRLLIRDYMERRVAQAPLAARPALARRAR